MADVSHAMEAKSDQLTAVEIVGAEPVIRVREVKIRKGEQPVHVFFDGDNGRPWKPSKGMIRVLAAAWGRESDQWVGKYARLYFEPSVKYAGKEVGGIRINGLSDIKPEGLKMALTINRSTRISYHVECIKAPTGEYPADKFEAALPAMVEKMHAEKDPWSLQQVIAKCQQTGRLTAEQIKRLEENAPIEVGEDDTPTAGDDEEEF